MTFTVAVGPGMAWGCGLQGLMLSVPKPWPRFGFSYGCLQGLRTVSHLSQARPQGLVQKLRSKLYRAIHGNVSQTFMSISMYFAH